MSCRAFPDEQMEPDPLLDVPSSQVEECRMSRTDVKHVSVELGERSVDSTSNRPGEGMASRSELLRLGTCSGELSVARSRCCWARGEEGGLGEGLWQLIEDDF